MITSVRELVDPNNTLPSVDLVVVERQAWEGEPLIREKMEIMEEGRQVGDCTLVTQNYPHSSKVHFDGINIRNVNRGVISQNVGRGLGLASYLKAIEIAHERGLPFETQDYNQTAAAKRIWEVLVAKGAR